MIRRLKELAVFISVLAVLGLLVVASGIVPIKASSGHWAITQWFLDFASDRSIAFHSQGIDTPPLDEPGMVRLGAATYETNCSWCHGRPGERRPPVANGMTPQPPDLVEAAQAHASRELFYVVKHGIKFAGMPAWPNQKRDEEIWPVVAFLKRLPSLEADEYQQLIAAPKNMDQSTAGEGPGIAQRAAELCGACHGLHGHGGVHSLVPALAGQNESYLRLSLNAYRTAQRTSGIMRPIASQLSEPQIAELSAFYASQPHPFANHDAATEKQAVGPQQPSAALWKLGEELAHQGSRQKKIPSCVDCHGPGENLTRDEYPRLSGQPAEYLSRQLALFSERQRGGSQSASLMHPIADKLDARQREALATFYHNPSGPP